MKIKVTTEELYEFDEKRELQRLKACFKGEILERQLKIFNHFLKGENDELQEEFYNLPYDEEEECSEMEYVGLWMGIISGDQSRYKYLVDMKSTVEFV